MRRNTYIRFEELCRKFKGYVGTKELLEEGFSNRPDSSSGRRRLFRKDLPWLLLVKRKKLWQANGL